MTLAHAKRLLVEDASVLDAALAGAGLSGPSRLHDLFVTCEAMTPGEFKAHGFRPVIRWGLHDGPLGRVLLGVTERGVCWLSFVGHDATAVDEFQGEWQAATLVRDQATTADYMRPCLRAGGTLERPPAALAARHPTSRSRYGRRCASRSAIS